MAQFITPRLTPKPSTTSQSDRERPRSTGRATASSTTALVTRRSHTIVVGATSSNRLLAIPAPNCTDRMPASTSQIGEIGETSPRDEFGAVTRSI